MVSLLISSVAFSNVTEESYRLIGVYDVWEVTDGTALVGIIDVGVDTQHPKIVTFDENNVFMGGNFRKHLSQDFIINNDDLCLEDDDVLNCVDEYARGGFGYMYDIAGHGTHVFGLIAANGDIDERKDIVGVCKNCSVIIGRTISSYRDRKEAMYWMVDHGVQVINMSFGTDGSCKKENNYKSYYSLCEALEYADNRGVILVAATGNDLDEVEFPASDDRVVGVGAIYNDGRMWDMQWSFDGCPCSRNPRPSIGCYSDEDTTECGSNYSINGSEFRHELVMPGVNLESIFYTDKVWSEPSRCMDTNLSDGKGYGTCTGTSMSSAVASGVFGLLKSIMPTLDKDVFLQIVYDSASNNGSWNNKTAYGYIQSGKVLDEIMGMSNGKKVKNRLTPLFHLYSPSLTDHVFTASPQMASSYHEVYDLKSKKIVKRDYIDKGKLVAGYDSFPGLNQYKPRADIFVFTTKNDVDGTLVKLHQMSKVEDDSVDHVYITDSAEIENYHINGYEYDGIVGYIYSPEIIPPEHAKQLFLNVDNDGSHYLSFINGGGEIIGYAFENNDSDNDGLIDGAEFVLGTNPYVVDSDCDGTTDGIEYPMYKLPVSDPLSVVCENTYSEPKSEEKNNTKKDKPKKNKPKKNKPKKDDSSTKINNNFTVFGSLLNQRDNENDNNSLVNLFNFNNIVIIKQKPKNKKNKGNKNKPVMSNKLWNLFYNEDTNNDCNMTFLFLDDGCF